MPACNYHRTKKRGGSGPSLLPRDLSPLMDSLSAIKKWRPAPLRCDFVSENRTTSGTWHILRAESAFESEGGSPLYGTMDRGVATKWGDRGSVSRPPAGRSGATTPHGVTHRPGDGTKPSDPFPQAGSPVPAGRQSLRHGPDRGRSHWEPGASGRFVPQPPGIEAGMHEG
jgi:hypothetical protein